MKHFIIGGILGFLFAFFSFKVALIFILGIIFGLITINLFKDS